MLARRTTIRIAIIACLTALGAVCGRANPEPQPDPRTESAQAAHAMLTRLCDDFGGRLTGAPSAQAAMARLESELRDLGLKPEWHLFTMPGWERGADRVTMVEPFARELRVSAFGYTQPHPVFTARVVDLGAAGENDWPSEPLDGAIGLVGPHASASLRETVRRAQARGLRGLLFGGREPGGQLLLRTGSHVGEPLPLPAYSLTMEEARWLQRLITRKVPVSVRMETHSRCQSVETANLSVTLAGRTSERIIVGAHFDSWDIGQGAIDNGLGVAQVFALAHLLREQRLARTVELVWFNGEEQGLGGSREQARVSGEAPVIAMINLDMVGVPQAVNALGDETLVPFLERWNAARGDQKLPLGVQNKLWIGSDHTPYQLAGIRTITFHGPIDHDSVRYYHDFADTIDKLPEKVVADSVAVIADLVVALANDTTLKPERRPSSDTEEMFRKAGVDQRMRALGWWPFP